jgi:hypothetical protein
MPQLTPEFERVIINTLPSPDATRFDMANYKMRQEVRTSEDYCHSDNIIAYLGKFTLGHVPKLSLTDMKKYEFCVLVSVLVIRNVC